MDEVSADIKKKLRANLFKIKNLGKPKKSYGHEATDFHDKEITKAGSDCTCLSVITTDSALKKYENHYPQAFLKECKYIEKEGIKLTTEDIKVFSSDSNEE